MSTRVSLLLVVSCLTFVGACNSLRSRGTDWMETRFVEKVLSSDYGAVDVNVRSAGGRRSLLVALGDSPFQALPDAEKRKKALEIARVAYALLPSKDTLTDVSVSFVTKKSLLSSPITNDADRITFDMTELVPSLDRPLERPQPPSAPPPVAEEEEEEVSEPTGPTIDASTVTDGELCIKAGRSPNPISNQEPAQLLAAMRSGLRSLRTIQVRGVEKREIPKIKSWSFAVSASRQSGLSYVAESSDGSKIRIVQVPGGKTYASGKFLFMTDPVLSEKVGDEWFEVPAALLTVNPSDAHPDGPQGFFGMDIGYKAAIADFAQGAIAWYPDEQAKWLFARKKKTGASSQTKELTTIDQKNPYFGNCRALLIKARSLSLELSASGKPLPLQSDPAPGVISSSYRWGRYNQPMPTQKEPPGAVTLEALEARK